MIEINISDNRINFQEIEEFLCNNEKNYSKNYTLDYVRVLFRKLNIEKIGIPCIHVTGTNGKGSTCAMLESICRSAGYKTGMFTSPHLKSITERIKINNKNIPKCDFVRFFLKVNALVKQIKTINQCFLISSFEYLTALAILYFQSQNVDVVILEVGLGGTLDATNVVLDTSCSVFTSIAIDHEEILGNSIEKIATDKAGIIKINHNVVLSPAISNVAKDIIIHIATEKYAKSIINVDKVEYQFKYNNIPAYQNINATTAVAAINAMQEMLPVSKDAIKIGLESFLWPGRWQLILNDKYPNGIILDGAHNAEGAQMIVNELVKLPQKPVLIFGSNKISRASKMLKILVPYIEKLVFTQSNHSQALTSTELYACIENTNLIEVETVQLDSLLSFLQQQNRLVLISGSIYLIGDVMSLLRL